jgi:hypothetical protein
VTSRLHGDRKTNNLFLQCIFYDPNYGRQPVALSYVNCCGDLNVLVPSLLNELRNDLFASESEILTSRDYADLVTILDELTKVEILFFMQFMLTIHCKKRLEIFPFPSRDVTKQTKQLKSLVTDIPTGDRRIANPFLQCTAVRTV